MRGNMREEYHMINSPKTTVDFFHTTAEQGIKLENRTTVNFNPYESECSFYSEECRVDDTKAGIW